MRVSWEASLPAALLLGCLASFWWGMRSFFTRPAGFTAAMRLISAFAAIFGVMHLIVILFVSSATPQRSLAGSVLYLCSAGLFWWAIKTSLARPLSAAFSPDAPSHLVDDGPYRFIRHPLYTSYIVTWLAGWIVTAQWWLIPTALIMVVIYFVASTAEEDKFLRSSLAGAYQKYRLHTGRFLPNPVKLLANLPAHPGTRRFEAGPSE